MADGPDKKGGVEKIPSKTAESKEAAQRVPSAKEKTREKVNANHIKKIQEWLNAPKGRGHDLKERATEYPEKFPFEKETYDVLMSAITKVTEALRTIKEVDLEMLDSLTEDERETFKEILFGAERDLGATAPVGEAPKESPETMGFAAAVTRLTWFQYDIREKYLPPNSPRPKEYASQVERILELLETHEGISLFDLYTVAVEGEKSTLQRRQQLADGLILKIVGKDTTYYTDQYRGALWLIVGLVQKSIIPLKKYAAHRLGKGLDNTTEWMKELKAYEIFRMLSTTGAFMGAWAEETAKTGRAYMTDLVGALKGVKITDLIAKGLTSTAELASEMWGPVKQRIQKLQIPPEAATAVFGSLVDPADLPSPHANINQRKIFQDECIGFLTTVMTKGSQELSVFKNALRNPDPQSPVAGIVGGLSPLQKKILGRFCDSFSGEKGQKIVEKMMNALQVCNDGSEGALKALAAVREIFTKIVIGGSLEMKDALILYHLTEYTTDDTDGRLTEGGGLMLGLKCMQLIESYAGDEFKALDLSVPLQQALFSRMIGLACAGIQNMDIEDALEELQITPAMKKELRNVVLYMKDEWKYEWERMVKITGTRGVIDHFKTWWWAYLAGGVVGIRGSIEVGRRVRRRFRRAREFRDASLRDIAQRYRVPLRVVEGMEQNIRNLQTEMQSVYDIRRNISSNDPNYKDEHSRMRRSLDRMVNEWVKKWTTVFRKIGTIESQLHAQHERGVRDLRTRVNAYNERSRTYFVEQENISAAERERRSAELHQEESALRVQAGELGMNLKGMAGDFEVVRAVPIPGHSNPLAGLRTEAHGEGIPSPSVPGIAGKAQERSPLDAKGNPRVDEKGNIRPDGKGNVKGGGK